MFLLPQRMPYWLYSNCFHFLHLLLGRTQKYISLTEIKHFCCRLSWSQWNYKINKISLLWGIGFASQHRYEHLVLLTAAEHSCKTVQSTPLLLPYPPGPSLQQSISELLIKYFCLWVHNKQVDFFLTYHQPRLFVLRTKTTAISYPRKSIKWLPTQIC